ncbi:MAG TPA: porin [Burkholderiales bacterium]|jgi:predicted porin
MQKKLLGLAVAGALAAPGAALAQVEVYGFISVAVSNFKYSDGTAAGTPSVSKWDVSSHGTNYGVRGRENLGGGLTAWFQIEQNAPMERSNNVAITPASRNSAVGFQGNWGNFFIGQWTTPWADLESLWSIGAVGGYSPSLSIIGRRETTGTSPNPNCINGHVSGAVGFTTTQPVCDPVEAAGGIGHPFWRRISQSIFYYSPVFGGAQVKLAYQTNDGKSTQSNATTTVADPSMWSAAVQWSGMGGRARVGAAFDSHKDFSTIGQTDSGFAIKGGYDFGIVDVGLAYESMTYKSATGDCDAVQMGVALAIPIGQGHIRASYSQADDLDGTFNGAGTCGAAGAGDNGAKEYTIGYDYRFSKRTTVGVGYAQIKNDPSAVFTWTGAPGNQSGTGLAPFPGSDPSAFFLSVIHRF